MRWIGLVGAVGMLSSVQAADLPETASHGSPLASAADNTAPRAGMTTFAVCTQAAAQWAQPYSPISFEAAMAGPVQRHFSGKRVVPIFVKITYDREGGPETRKEVVECTVTKDGTSVTLMDR